LCAVAWHYRGHTLFALFWLPAVSDRTERFIETHRLKELHARAAQSLTGAVDTVKKVIDNYRNARVCVQGNWSWIQCVKSAAKTYQEWKRTPGHTAATNDVKLHEKLAQQLQLKLEQYVIC
jgi:hypothetical protein